MDEILKVVATIVAIPLVVVGLYLLWKGVIWVVAFAFVVGVCSAVGGGLWTILGLEDWVEAGAIGGAILGVVIWIFGVVEYIKDRRE